MTREIEGPDPGLNVNNMAAARHFNDRDVVAFPTKLIYGFTENDEVVKQVNRDALVPYNKIRELAVVVSAITLKQLEGETVIVPTVRWLAPYASQPPSVEDVIRLPTGEGPWSESQVEQTAQLILVQYVHRAGGRLPQTQWIGRSDHAMEARLCEQDEVLTMIQEALSSGEACVEIGVDGIRLFYWTGTRQQVISIGLR